MPSSSFRTMFAAINMRAIDLMRWTMFSQAEDLLDQGIEYLETNSCQEQRVCRNASRPMIRDDACTIRLESAAVVHPATTFAVGSKQDSAFAMYDRAFGVSSANISGSSLLPKLTYSDYNLLLCVFHYNLGLCYRLASLASQRARVPWDELAKSLFAYEMAYNYLQDVMQDEHPSIWLLELALLNNMGHIYCLLWDTEEALFRLGQMKVILEEDQLLHRLCQNQHPQHVAFIDEDISLFSCNVNYNESMLAGIPPPAA